MSETTLVILVILGVIVFTALGVWLDRKSINYHDDDDDTY